MKYQLATTQPHHDDRDCITGWTTRIEAGYAYHTLALAQKIAAKRYEDEKFYLGDGEDIFAVEAGTFKRVWREQPSAPDEQRTYEYDMPF